MKRFPRLLAVLCAVIVAAMVPARPALAVTCADLDGASIYSDEDLPVYLGFFGGATAQNSVMNLSGPYGSAVGANSVRNTHLKWDPPPWGKYGNIVSLTSVNNLLATHPPLIVHGGHIIYRLTSNPLIPGGITLRSIDLGCTFTAMTHDTSRPLPGVPAWIRASDGEFSDKIAVRWGAAPGASVYILTMSNGPRSPWIAFPETSLMGMDVVGLKPGQVYKFGVMGVNDIGPGSYVYDEGSMAVAGVNTPTATPGGTPAGTPVDTSSSLTPTPTSDDSGSPTPSPTAIGTLTPTPEGTPAANLYLPVTRR